MKLKYFLRGVGVGVIFGALIMMAAYLISGSHKISDKEIIERAENLGMVKQEDLVISGTKEGVENDTNTSVSNDISSEESVASNSTEEIIQDSDVSLEGVVDGNISDASSEQTIEATGDSKEGDTTETVKTDYVTAKISVTSGMTSYEVAMLLQEAGIIEDYLDFDNYLNQNGYSTQIRINDYEFNSNMTYEELAEALIKEDKQ